MDSIWLIPTLMTSLSGQILQAALTLPLANVNGPCRAAQYFCCHPQRHSRYITTKMPRQYIPEILDPRKSVSFSPVFWRAFAVEQLPFLFSRLVSPTIWVPQISKVVRPYPDVKWLVFFFFLIGPSILSARLDSSAFGLERLVAQTSMYAIPSQTASASKGAVGT